MVGVSNDSVTRQILDFASIQSSIFPSAVQTGKPNTVFDLTPALCEFVGEYAEYGFESESALVCAALKAFQEELVHAQFVESAALYAELYANDADLQVLTGQASAGWPD